MNNETNKLTESTVSSAVQNSDLKPQQSLRDLHQLAEETPAFHTHDIWTDNETTEPDDKVSVSESFPTDNDQDFVTAYGGIATQANAIFWNHLSSDDISDNDVDETGLDEHLERTKAAYEAHAVEEVNKTLSEDESENLDFHERYLEDKIKEYLIKLGLNIDSNRFGLLSDSEILDLCVTSKMISPYKNKQVKADHRGKIISYGLSSVGYDATMAYEVKVPKLLRGPDGSLLPLDPLAADDTEWETTMLDTGNGKSFYLLQPGEHILSSTREYFRMPDDVAAICLGKSTYARTGVIINVTPLEPGWHGNVTLEIHNSTCRPVKIYPGMGICQFLFFRTSRPKTTYADRKGKYQGQRGITLSKV